MALAVFSRENFQINRGPGKETFSQKRKGRKGCDSAKVTVSEREGKKKARGRGKGGSIFWKPENF